MPLLPCVILASGRRRHKVAEQRIVVQVSGTLLIKSAFRGIYLSIWFAFFIGL
jgi:hypothetical protein